MQSATKIKSETEKENEGEMESGKVTDVNGNGGTAGMMSNIVNKVTDFFSAPDEDDEGEVPQLSGSDTPKPVDAAPSGIFITSYTHPPSFLPHGLKCITDS